MTFRDALGRGVAAAGSGVLFALAQPGFGFWPLAFVCAVPLLAAWRGVRLRARAALGWLAGTVGTTIATFEAGVSGASAYFDLSGPLSLLVALGVGQVFGAFSFVGLSVFAGDPVGRSGGWATIRFGAVWAGMELLRGTVLTGFPWLLLAYALLPVPELAGAAAHAGAASVSLLLAWLQAAVAVVVLGRSGRVRAGAAGVLAAGLLAGPAVWPVAEPGAVREAAGDVDAGGDAKRVLLVQPGSRTRDGDSGGAQTTRELVRRTQSAGDFDLAIWPENASPAVLPENLHLVRAALEGRPDAALILGAPRSGASPGSIHTSAVLVDSRREAFSFHDKVKLLPFAEYAPGPLPMRWFGAIEVEAGDAPRRVQVDGVSYGPLICYEVLFSGVAREQARAGAQVLLNLSNDAWFGNTGAVEQHLAAAMYRALETGRPLLRATQTGITAAIDVDGRVVARLPLDAPGTLLVDVHATSGTTPARLWGDAPVWLAFSAVVVFAVLGRWRRGSRVE